MFHHYLCAAALLAVTSIVPARAGTPLPVAGPVVEGVASYRLANGLQLLLVPDNSKPTTMVTVNYFVGSRDELYGESGSAHLLEHMLFLGTPTVPSPRDEFRRRGMSQNATTFADRTVYFESFTADSACMPASAAKDCRSNLEWALMMEADRMVNASVTPESLAKEMTVVRNELERGENSPGNLLHQRLLATAFRYNKYREPTIGNRSDVEQVDLDRLRALYHRYYRPDNAIVTIAGSFDRAQALEWVQRYFGPLSHPESPIERRHSIEPPQDGERSVTLRRQGDVPFLMASYHVPACTHPDYAPLAVLAYLIANGADGRIQKQLIDTKQALGGSANTDCTIDPGLFQVSITLPKDANLAAAEQSLTRLVEQDLLDSIHDDEIARAVAAYANGSRSGMSNAFNLAAMAGSGAAMGDWRLPFILRDRLEAVSPADVRRVAQYYLKPANRTLGRFIPAEKRDQVEVPAAPLADSLAKEYKGRDAVSAGERFEPSTANIRQRLITGQLPNGLRYALLPRKLRGDKVYINMQLRFGDTTTLMGREITASTVGSLLGKATRTRDKVALTAAINQLRSGYQLHAGAQGVTASLHTERSQLDGALALLHDMLREPVFEPTEFAIEKNVRLENLAAARKTTDPDRLATRALSRHFAGNWPAGDLRHEMTFDEEQQELDRLSLEGVKTFYETFYGVNEGELVIVGDIDPPQVTTTLTALFGDWRASKPYAFAEEPYVDVKPARFQIQTADRANAVYAARANLPVYLDHPDRLAVEVANHLLGGGDKSRLFQRIRTQEGLSYGIYSSLNFGRIDKWSSWRIHGTFAPENRAKVEALVKEEIEKVRREGFTQQELDDLKAGWMQNMQARLANESYQLGMLERLLRWQEPLDRNDREIAALRALTLADVNRAMQQYLNPERLSIAVAGNFGDSAGTGDSPTASSSH